MRLRPTVCPKSISAAQAWHVPVPRSVWGWWLPVFCSEVPSSCASDIAPERGAVIDRNPLGPSVCRGRAAQRMRCTAPTYCTIKPRLKRNLDYKRVTYPDLSLPMLEFPQGSRLRMVSTRPIVGLPLCILNQESTPQAMFSGDSGFLEGSSPSIIVCERRSCPPTGAFLSSSSTETIRAPYEYVHLSLPMNETT